MGKGGIYKDTDLFPFRCPCCDHHFKKQVGWIKTGRKFLCPACGVALGYQVKEILRVIGQLRRGLYDFKGHFLATTDQPSKLKH